MDVGEASRRVDAFLTGPIDFHKDGIVWFLLLPVVGFLTMQFTKLVIWLLKRARLIENVERKLLKKGALALEKAIKDFDEELTDYDLTLKDLILCDVSRPSQIKPAIESFKIAINKLALPKISTTKYREYLYLCYIHRDMERYYRVLHKAENLMGFCESYKTYYAKVNWEYIEDIESFVTSLYHVTQIKPGTEFIMQRHTERDAERAIGYFKNYAKLVEWSLNHAKLIRGDLETIIKENKYRPWLAFWV